MKTRSAFLYLVIAAILGLFAAANSARAQDKQIRIGGLFPMSGPGAYFGAQDKQGVELALEQLNKAGVNGYKFTVQYEDSSCGPLPATQAAKRLIEAVEADARRRGLPGVQLGVRVVLTANQKLFNSMGYVETSRESHPGFDYPTSINMRKSLK